MKKGDGLSWPVPFNEITARQFRLEDETRCDLDDSRIGGPGNLTERSAGDAGRRIVELRVIE